MLQQTQVKTVIPFWNRWMKELPTIEATANAPSAKIHKLWEGLGYYTRVRNLQKAAQIIVASHGGKFPEKFEDILALPGIGRYTAGAISSIAFNQPAPILDGNVIRVLTRVFGIGENPKEKETNAQLWQLAEDLAGRAKNAKNAKDAKEKSTSQTSRPSRDTDSCSQLNQSLMELGALVCTPRNAQCLICPVQKLCAAFAENRVEELPNLGKRESATARHFLAFAVECGGKFLVQQRPAGVVNAHLWEFPNVEITDAPSSRPSPSVGEKVAGGRLRGSASTSDSFDTATIAFQKLFGVKPKAVQPLRTVKHSITRYRITLEAFLVDPGGTSSTSPHSKKIMFGTRIAHPAETNGRWLAPEEFDSLAFSSAHKKLASAAAKSILSGR